MQTTNLNAQTNNAAKLQGLGAGIIRYGLAIILIWIGTLKFTDYEAMGIQPLVAHSPLLSWVYGIFSVGAFSMLLGMVEILMGLLIAARNFAPIVSAIGSVGAMATFFVTLTFLLSTPGTIQVNGEFPFLSTLPGQFLLKDIVLFGAATWTAGEALSASAN